jgi:hypothetical protein
MPVLTITQTYKNGNAPTQGDLDNIFNSILVFVNVVGLDGTNFSSGGLTNASFKAGTLVTSNFATGAVTQAKIAANAVTQQKRASQIVVKSASCGSYSTNSGSFVAIRNFSVSLVTVGRPVCVFIQDDGSNAFTGASTFIGPMYIQITRDTTPISGFYVSGVPGQELAFAYYQFIDNAPSAGTHTYAANFATTNGSDTVSVINAVLGAYEL